MKAMSQPARWKILIPRPLLQFRKERETGEGVPFVPLEGIPSPFSASENGEGTEG